MLAAGDPSKNWWIRERAVFLGVWEEAPRALIHIWDGENDVNFDLSVPGWGLA